MAGGAPIFGVEPIVGVEPKILVAGARFELATFGL
jgi:hypothetical protein